MQVITAMESNLATKKCIADALFLSGSLASCYYSSQVDSAVLNAYLWTEHKRNLPSLDAFSGLFYAQNVFAAGAPFRNPLGELTVLTQTL